jgi:nucleoid-associated protein YgaU
MRRYSSTQIQTRYDGKRVYKTTIYPVIPPSTSDIQVVSNEGDYLDTLAYKYYGDPTLWFIIALANPGIGKGRFSVDPGLSLRIPTNINDIINQFNLLNS